MKVITKDIPIYFGYLRIVIAKDFVKAVKKLKVDVGDFNVQNFLSFVDTDRTDGNVARYTLFMHEDIEPSVIAHEAVHLTNYLFIDLSMKLDPFNDESQAYLTGWFVNEIHKELKK